MKLQALLKGIGVLETNAPMDMEINGVSYASNTVQKGEMFVAVPGFATDGHRYIPDAVARGASVVLCEREMPANVPWVRVASSREALAQLGVNWYGDPSASMQVVGVTGTNGKTSVTTILKSVLEKNYKILSGLLHENRLSVDFAELSLLGYNPEFVTTFHKTAGRTQCSCYDIMFMISAERIYNIHRSEPMEQVCL